MAELLAHLCIGDRLVEHGLGQPDELRRAHQRAEIEQQGIVAGVLGRGDEIA